MELLKLVAQLASPVADKRDEARASLLAAGMDAVAPLMAALHNPVRDVRGAAALTLGELGAREAIDALAEMAKSDPDDSVRPLAMRALSDLATPDAPAKLKLALIDGLGAKDMFCRALACTGLGRIGGEHAIEALRIAGKDREEWVRDAARKALAVAVSGGAPSTTEDASTGSAEGATSTALVRADPSSALVTRDAAIAQLASELLALDPARQARARDALAEHGEASVVAVAPMLFDQVASTRRAAAETLGAIGSPKAIDALAEVLADEDAPQGILAVSLHALGQIVERVGPVDTFPRGLVTSCLGDPDPYVRAAAAGALIRSGGGARLEGLEAVIDDDEDWVHVAGLGALVAVADPDDDERLRGPLLDGLARVTDADALCLLLEAIAQVFSEPVPEDLDAVGPLSHFLRDDQPRLRQRAAIALAALTPCMKPGTLDDETIDRLVRLADTDPEVVGEVIAVLAAGSPVESVRATAGLARHLRSRDRDVAQAAARALGHVGGRAALDALVEMANADPDGRAGWTVVVAAQVLAELPDDAPVAAQRDDQGRWWRRVRLLCAACNEAPPLAWQPREGREELRCPSCQAEHVVGANEKAMLVSRAPFGVCRCCKRKRLLVRRGESQVLVCPTTDRTHVRPYDHPRQARLLDELPHGACECCVEPQPLIRLDERVVCYRTRREHVASDAGYTLPRERVADDVAAINEALLAGTLGIGQSGLPAVTEDDEGAAGEGDA